MTARNGRKLRIPDARLEFGADLNGGDPFPDRAQHGRRDRPSHPTEN